MSQPGIYQLAKIGDFHGFKEALADGAEVEVERVFERAVTDFRTVKRKPGHLAILKWCLDQELRIDRRTVWLAARFANHSLVGLMNERGLPDDPFVDACIGNIERLETRNHLGRLHDEDGLNLLHYCAGSGLGRHDPLMGRRLESTCRHLLLSGVDPIAVVHLDVTHTPAFRCASSGGNTAIMQMLLNLGIVSASDLHQPLEFALEPHQRSGEPFFEIAEQILEYGFDINSARLDQGRTLLHGSANRGSVVAVRWLLDHGANPNERDVQGRTPLHVAAKRNTHTTVVEMLLDAGTDPGALDDEGHTALDLAGSNGRDKVAARLALI